MLVFAVFILHPFEISLIAMSANYGTLKDGTASAAPGGGSSSPSPQSFLASLLSPPGGRGRSGSTDSWAQHQFLDESWSGGLQLDKIVEVEANSRQSSIGSFASEGCLSRHSSGPSSGVAIIYGDDDGYVDCGDSIGSDDIQCNWSKTLRFLGLLLAPILILQGVLEISERFDGAGDRGHGALGANLTNVTTDGGQGSFTESFPAEIPADNRLTVPT